MVYENEFYAFYLRVVLQAVDDSTARPASGRRNAQDHLKLRCPVRWGGRQRGFVVDTQTRIFPPPPAWTRTKKGQATAPACTGTVAEEILKPSSGGAGKYPSEHPAPSSRAWPVQARR